MLVIYIDLYVTLKLCRRNAVPKTEGFVVVGFRLRGVDFFRKLIYVILRNRSFGVREIAGHGTCKSALAPSGL